MMRIAGEACFPVDANLRPEGRQGALVRTLDGHVAYYKRWAKTWEFQALLKARPVAGDPELGEAYAEAVAPMVWTAAGRPDFVADVQAMRRRVEEHVRPDHADRELKLGRGGLRDVEFAVQLLQLVHGRADPALRSPTTLDALARARERRLRRARRRGEPRRVVPVPARCWSTGCSCSACAAPTCCPPRTTRTRCAGSRARPSCGRTGGTTPSGCCWRSGGATPGGCAGCTRSCSTGRCSTRRPGWPTPGSPPRPPTVRLGALGWASPEGALHHIRALTGGVSRAAAIQKALLPVLLDELARTPDPDRGLLAYRRVSEALARTPWYLRLLRDEGLVAERLMTLLGTSALVPDLLVRAPRSCGCSPRRSPGSPTS